MMLKKFDTKKKVVSPGDLLWSHLNDPKNQPVITIIMDFEEGFNSSKVVESILENETLNKVMVDGFWLPKKKAGFVRKSDESVETLLKSILPSPLSTSFNPYMIYVGSNYIVLRVHHGLGDGKTLMNALLKENNLNTTQRKNRPVPLKSIIKSLQEIIMHKAAGLGEIKGFKNVELLGPWDLKSLKEVSKNKNLTLNELFLQTINKAAKACGKSNISAGATVESSGLGANSFGLMLTKLSNLNTFKMISHAAASLGVINFVGKLGKKPANILVKFLSKRVDLLVSNVKGPEQSVSLDGETIKNLHFLVPTIGTVMLGVTLMSYNEKVNVSVSWDKNIKMDMVKFNEILNEEFSKLSNLVA